MIVELTKRGFYTIGFEITAPISSDDVLALDELDLKINQLVKTYENTIRLGRILSQNSRANS